MTVINSSAMTAIRVGKKVISDYQLNCMWYTTGTDNK